MAADASASVAPQVARRLRRASSYVSVHTSSSAASTTSTWRACCSRGRRRDDADLGTGPVVLVRVMLWPPEGEEPTLRTPGLHYGAGAGRAEGNQPRWTIGRLGCRVWTHDPS